MGKKNALVSRRYRFDSEIKFRSSPFLFLSHQLRAFFLFIACANFIIVESHFFRLASTNLRLCLLLYTVLGCGTPWEVIRGSKYPSFYLLPHRKNRLLNNLGDKNQSSSISPICIPRQRNSMWKSVVTLINRECVKQVNKVCCIH